MKVTIAHHTLTNAQSGPQQQLAPPSQLAPVYTLSMMLTVREYPFGYFGSAVWLCSFPNSCAPLLGGRAQETEKSLT